MKIMQKWSYFAFLETCYHPTMIGENDLLDNSPARAFILQQLLNALFTASMHFRNEDAEGKKRYCTCGVLVYIVGMKISQILWEKVGG